MMHHFKIRPLSSPASRGSAIVIGPAMTAFLFYFSFLIDGVDSWLLLSIFLFILGLLVLSASILFVFGFMELTVDTKNNQWTESLNIFGLRTASKSEEIPVDLNYILIFDANYSFGGQYDDIPTDDIEFYETSVVYNDRRKKVFCLTDSRNKALEISETIKGIFNLEIIDKTIN